MSSPLAFDGNYLRSVPAFFKITCLLCTLSGFLCVLCSGRRVPPHNPRGLFYLSAAALAFLCSGCSLLAGLLQLWPRKFSHFDALRFEMLVHAFLACVTFVAAAVACSMDVLQYSLATFFGFFAACIYAYEAYVAYCLRRKCDAATQTQAV